MLNTRTPFDDYPKLNLNFTDQGYCFQENQDTRLPGVDLFSQERQDGYRSRQRLVPDEVSIRGDEREESSLDIEQESVSPLLYQAVRNQVRSAMGTGPSAMGKVGNQGAVG